MKYLINSNHGPHSLHQLRIMWDNGTLSADASYFDELRLEWLPLQPLMENSHTLFNPAEVFVRIGESKLRGCLCVYNKDEKINIFADGGFVLSASSGQMEGEFALTRALQLEHSSYEWISNAEPLTSNLRINITEYALQHSIARDVHIGATAKQKQNTKILRLEVLEKIAPKTNYSLVSVSSPTLKLKLKKITNILGREHTCDVVIDELNISRRHCLLEVGDKNVKVKDLESSNGTSVNGVRVKDGVLKLGDQLSLGTYRLVLCDESIK